jgi:hypothetical protein
MGQTKRTIASNCALAIQYSGNPVGRHVKLPAKFGGAHAKFLKLFGEVLAGMNSSACHKLLPQ